MNLKDTLIPVVASVVCAVLVVGVFFAPEDGRPGRDGSVGASAGPDVTESTYFRGGASFGSGCFSTSTTGILTADELDNSCLYVAATGAGQAALSLTLPSAADINGRFLPVDGMCRDWQIDASDVAAATTTTFVAGANTDVVGLDATGAGTGADVLDGAEFGTLKLCRQTGDRVTAYIQEWIHAD